MTPVTSMEPGKEQVGLRPGVFEGGVNRYPEASTPGTLSSASTEFWASPSPFLHRSRLVPKLDFEGTFGNEGFNHTPRATSMRSALGYWFLWRRLFAECWCGNHFLGKMRRVSMVVSSAI